MPALIGYSSWSIRSMDVSIMRLNDVSSAILAQYLHSNGSGLTNINPCFPGLIFTFIFAASWRGACSSNWNWTLLTWATSVIYRFCSSVATSPRLETTLMLAMVGYHVKATTLILKQQQQHKQVGGRLEMKPTRNKGRKNTKAKDSM